MTIFNIYIYSYVKLPEGTIKMIQNIQDPNHFSAVCHESSLKSEARQSAFQEGNGVSSGYLTYSYGK